MSLLLRWFRRVTRPRTPWSQLVEPPRPAVVMITCSRCGERMPARAYFCRRCGASMLR